MTEADVVRRVAGLTPRTAAVLRVALLLLAERIRRDVEELGDRPVVLGEHRRLAALDRFPIACWTMDARWRRHLADAAAELAADLAAGLLPRPRCVGQARCLDLAVEDAEDAVNDDVIAEAALALPADERDYDWDVVDALLEPEGDDFDPQSWFTPIDDAFDSGCG